MASASPPPDPSQWQVLTQHGQQSALHGIFKIAGGYEGLEQRILKNLSNDDFTALRRTCKYLNHRLTTSSPSTSAAASGPCYQADLMDKCDEKLSPRPVGIVHGPSAPCLNAANSQVQIRACRIANFSSTSHGEPHNVCSCCRDLWHHSNDVVFTNTFFRPSAPHEAYRQDIAAAHVPVCLECETTERANHPFGYDGCVCYRELYQKRWLCWRCDDQNLIDLRGNTWDLLHHFLDDRLRLVGNSTLIVQTPPPYGRPERPMCLCGRGRITSRFGPYAKFRVTYPFEGNDKIQMVRRHMMGIPINEPLIDPPIVRQCVMCYGFVVRAAPAPGADERPGRENRSLWRRRSLGRRRSRTG